ncbi:MAG: hypothetical protein IPM29_05955 [Planctomycetes bacterium]|nr:hypothetical protein [Planctomycetota bacterium]
MSGVALRTQPFVADPAANRAGLGAGGGGRTVVEGWPTAISRAAVRCRPGPVIHRSEKPPRMNSMTANSPVLLLLRSASVAAILAAAGHAQIATLTLPASIGDDPRSVVRVNGGTHLAISNQVDGWLHMVNVTNPLSPSLTTSYNPPFGDQWFEAEYTPQFGGRLFTGHRGGGINIIDVSNPLSPSAVASIPSIYHFRGMRYRTVGSGGALFYNETNNGLGVYQVNNTGTNMSLVWNDYAPNQDGNGMEIVGDLLYQMGTPANTTSTRLHRGFDIGNPFLPVMTMNNTLTNQAPTGGHCLLRKQPGSPYVLAARWNDGLQLHDCTFPNNPVVYPILPASPAVVCWGAAWISPVFAVAYGSFTIGNINYYWWLILQVTAGPSILPLNLVMVPLDTHDITADPNTNRIYVVGRMNGNGQGVLWVF